MNDSTRFVRAGEPPLEAWRRCWRGGIAPQLSTSALAALWLALLRDSAELVQGATTDPPPLECAAGEPVCAACAVAFAGWKGERLESVAECEGYFANVVLAADRLLGEERSARYFLNWYDETPRQLMRRLLLGEVELALAERGALPEGGAA